MSSSQGGVYIPCPFCNSTNVKSERKQGYIGSGVDVALKRRYTCRNCLRSFNTAEVTLIEPMGVSNES